VELVVKNLEAKGAKVIGNSIETDGTGEVSLILTMAESASSIEGVALREGKPFAGAMILLMPKNERDRPRLVRRDQSDSDGTFHLGAVLYGKYTLLALEHGWDMEWSKPEVLKPFLEKAQKLEITERQPKFVTIEVQ
jgi:hypothetical protein